MSTRRLHRSSPSVDDEEGATNPDYDVDAAVHSLITGMEESSVTSDDLVPDETEVLFVRSTDPRDVNKSYAMGGIGGTLADHEDDLLAEMENNHALNGEKPRKKFCSKGFCSKVIPCFCAGLFLMILASVIIRAANQQKAAAPTVQGSKQTIPAPPSNLSEVCSFHYTDELGNGLDACKAACSAGACCNELEESKNCFGHNAEFCAAYTICLILQDLPSSATIETSMERVPPPPTDLGARCSGGSMNDCTEACSPSKCCFAATNNCGSYGDNSQICSSYRQACMVLGADYGGISSGISDPTFGGGSSVAIPEASPDLEQMCEEASVATPMRGHCERVCRSAECCWRPYDGEHDTCVAGNEELCKGYSLCDNLNLVPSVPEIDVQVLCENGDPAQCQEECNKARCCVSPDSERNCFQHFAHICGMYSACSNVDPAFDQVHILPEAPSNLQSLCNSNADELSIASCRKYCKTSECCWMGNSGSTCPEGNEEICPGYSPCSFLDSHVPYAPTDLDEWCYGDALEVQEACRTACDAARCCVANDDTRCMNDIDICEDYFPCIAVDPAFAQMDLDGDGVADPFAAPAPDFLMDLCENPNSREECEIACEDAKCCIATDDASKCVNFDDYCAAYTPCAVLDPAYGDLGDQDDTQVGNYAPRAHSDLDEWCYSNASEALAQCKSSCEAAKCCIADVKCENFDDVCEDYFSCAPIDQAFEQLGQSYSNTAPMAHTDLDEWCFSDTAETKSQCQLACEAADCCVSEVKCDNYDDVCEDYFPCSAIDASFEKLGQPSSNSISVDHAPDDIGYKCNSLYFGVVMNLEDECDDLCRTALCCIDNDAATSCFQRNQDACLSYLPCFAVEPDFADMASDPHVQPQEAPPELASWCAGEDTTACQESCGGGTCCVEQLDKMNCLSTYNDDCHAYIPCRGMFAEFNVVAEDAGVGDPQDIPEPTVDLDTICSSDSLQDEEGRKECSDECSAASCCFEPSDSVDNCVSVNPLCSAYEACKILYADLSTPSSVPPAPIDLSDHCLQALNGNNDHVAVCEDLCRPASDCCIDDDQSTNCFQDNVEACMSYALCVAIDDTYSVMAVEPDDSYSYNPSDSMTVPPPPDDLADTCNPLYFVTDDDMDACDDACGRSFCCVDQTPGQNCLEDNLDMCLQYEPCASMDPEYVQMTAEQSPYTPPTKPLSLLTTMCNNASTGSEDARQACQGLCEPGECCVSGHSFTNCFDEYADICNEYQVCGIVFPQFDTMGQSLEYTVPPADNIEILCSTEMIDAARQDCVDACQLAECCFLPSDDPSACYNAQQERCDEYTACNNLKGSEDPGLLDSGTGGALPAPPSSLPFLCAETTVVVNSEPCENYCQDAECCFPDTYTGPAPCADDVQCPSYQVCKNLGRR